MPVTHLKSTFLAHLPCCTLIIVILHGYTSKAGASGDSQTDIARIQLTADGESSSDNQSILMRHPTSTQLQVQKKFLKVDTLIAFCDSG